MRYIIKDFMKYNKSYETDFNVKNAQKAMNFHATIPEYKRTPLVILDNLAKQLNIGKLYVKDESKRFGQNAFKVLGGSFALAMYISKQLDENCKKPYSLEFLKSAIDRGHLPKMTFITATDGNHGRGVAWAASRLNQNCIVYMPKGSSKERLEHIKSLGADACITELSYDDAVRKAADDAQINGWILVQDTSFEGYQEVPKTIMQGYTTFALEITEQLKGVVPTHIFLQAGVGAMAGAITGFFANYYKEKCPRIIIVEPEQADCIYKTAKADDGSLHFYTEPMETIMAGLACGEPCDLGWFQLSRYAYGFFSVEEEITIKGMRALGHPLQGDELIISGESGAVTTGLVIELMTNPELEKIRDEIGLDQNSVVLCVSTEGDTDSENYKKIVVSSRCT